MTKRIIYVIVATALLIRGLMLLNPTAVHSEAIVQYGYLTHSEVTENREIIWFWTYDTLYGPTRSNDWIGLKYSPHFFGEVITSQDEFLLNNANPYFEYDPIFNAPYFNVRDLSYLQDSADVSLGEAGITTRLHFNGEEGIDVFFFRNGNPPLNEFEEDSVYQTLEIEETQIIYVDGNCEVYGIVNGKYTVYVNGNIWLIDNIQYEGSQEASGRFEADEMEHLLALVAEKNIIIQNNSRNGREDGYGQYSPNSWGHHSIIINACLVALGESFTFQHQNDDWAAYQGPRPDERGIIHHTGSLYQHRRGYLHRSNHTGTGYGKDFNWDFRLERIVPPGFRAGLVSDMDGEYPSLYLPGGQEPFRQFITKNAEVGKLFIEPPMKIRFAEAGSLKVTQQLQIFGTEDESVPFTVEGIDPSAGISVIGISDISHAEFRQGVSVRLGEGEHQVQSSTFADSIFVNGDAVFASSTFTSPVIGTDGSTVRFVDCEFIGEENTSILYDAVLDNCTFAGPVLLLGISETVSCQFTEEVLIVGIEVVNCRTSVFKEGVELNGGNFIGKFENNLLDGASGIGMYFLADNARLLVRNNIITNNRVGISSQLADVAVFKYNNVYGNTDIDYEFVEPGEGSISEDPLFVSAENDDYHLAWGSPCINAGDPDSPLDSDGSYIEIGPYYYDPELSVDEKPSSVPGKFGLSAYPNPFNSEVMISVDGVSEAGNLDVFDVTGRLILSQDLAAIAGQSVVIQGTTLGNAGVYLIRYKDGERSIFSKITYLK